LRSWTLTDHPWLASPWGACQPDFIVERPAAAPLIIEAKLTWVDCTMQMHKYKVAVSAATEGRVSPWTYATPATGRFAPLGVQVCRRLLPASPDPAEGLDDVVDGSVILLWA